MLWKLNVTQATPNSSDYGPNVSLYQIEILFVIVGVEFYGPVLFEPIPTCL